MAVSAKESEGVETWTPELLIRLDWRRFVDLVRLVIAKGGYTPQSLAVRSDGAVLLSVTVPDAGRPDQLVGTAAWERPVVDGDEISKFLDEMRQRRFEASLFVTPGDFSPNAIAAAADAPVELVDGATFLEVLDRLPESDRLQLYKLSTGGSLDVPTCPGCSMGMMSFDPGSFEEINDVIMAGDETRVDHVRCAQLSVGRDAEVHFLEGVFAEDMIIEGRAVGNFECAGTVTIQEGGSLTGTLRAKALDLQPGGTIDGDLSFLNGETLVPEPTSPEMMRWRCPRCRLNWQTRELAMRAASGSLP